MSQFHIGQKLDLGGLFFRVEQGQKRPDDLVLDVWVPDVHSSGEWRPVEMRVVGMAHAFFCENEDRIFPPPRYLGAQCWREFLRLCEGDWEQASKRLAFDKALADQKRRAS
jgi:hypothetical protein